MPIEYRGHTFPGYNQPINNRGTSQHKKMVLAKKGGRVKLVRFGHRGYGHNISPERKANYLKRSAGIRNKSGELTKNDKFSANYWARKVLWPAGEETVSEKRANLQRLKSGFETLKSRRDIAGGLGGALAGGTLGYASGYTDESGESHRAGRALVGAVLGGVAGRAVGRMSEKHMRDLDDLRTHSVTKIREAEHKYKQAQDHIAKLRRDFDETDQYNQELLEQMHKLRSSLHKTSSFR